MKADQIANASNNTELDDVERIQLPDGTRLTCQQSRAIELYVIEQQTHKQIAKAVGYSTESGVSRLINSKRGREAIQIMVRDRLVDDGVLGLKTLRMLAKSAKSELVRLQAAEKLVARAFGSAETARPQLGGGRELSISINLDGGAHAIQPDASRLKDVTPDDV